MSRTLMLAILAAALAPPAAAAEIEIKMAGSQ